MRRPLQILFLLFIISADLLAQQSKMITVIGDSLVGKHIEGEMIREVIGHVILTQGDVRITCDRAIQYLSKNDALLQGNVVATQNNLIIKAPYGYYYGDERIAECQSGVRLNDNKVILTARKGNYYFNESRAYFTENVRLYDTLTTLTCEMLTYYKELEKAVAIKKVKMFDSLNVVTSDSLIHFRRDKISFANKNVKAYNKKNKVTVYGQHLEDYSKKKYTLVKGSPLLVQIDSSKGGIIDTLLISARVMEAFNDSLKKFVAKDSVEIIRGAFMSKSDYAEYFKEAGRVFTYKKGEAFMTPVLWYEGTQLTGDTVNIFLQKQSLDKVYADGNAFILSFHEGFEKRYDQISGDRLKMYFDTAGVKLTDVSGNVLSIYYVYEDKDPNGLIKSSAQSAKIFFRDKTVDEVKLYASPVSEFFPENKVEGNELSYTLPAFLIVKDRPQKKYLLRKIFK